MLPKGLVLLVICGLLFMACSTKEEEKEGIDYANLNLPQQPNILWIVAEDLSAYLPMFGDSTVATPNLSRLANEGVTYTNVFSPSGVCAPSRAAIATGMYPTRIGATHMRTGPWFNFKTTDSVLSKYGRPVYEAKPPAGTHMHSYYLRKAGYYCTNNDKEDYQFRCEMTAWDESSRKAHWRNRPGNPPFFSIFNLMTTHESRIWTKAKDSLWVAKDLEVPVEPYWPDTEIAKKDIRRMYSNIKEMDQQVGQILKELEQDGLLEKTIIFWYSDHGGPLPRQKRTIYDSGLHVPLIIRFPNQQFAGRRDDQLISFVDFKPTLLSLAGVAPPEYADGRAWMGRFRSNTPRSYIYAAADRFDHQHDRIRAVRDKRYKYVRNYLPNQSYYLPVKFRETMNIMKELLRMEAASSLTTHQALWFRKQKDPEELFDTWSDPDELNNLAESPEYLEKKKELQNALDTWISDMTDMGMVPEEEYIESVGEYWNQPKTATPTVTKDNNHWVLNCATEGASIGYQWLEEGQHPGEYWKIYSDSLPDSVNKKLVARAHRIGYKPSDLVQKSKTE